MPTRISRIRHCLPPPLVWRANSGYQQWLAKVAKMFHGRGALLWLKQNSFVLVSFQLCGQFNITTFVITVSVLRGNSIQTAADKKRWKRQPCHAIQEQNEIYDQNENQSRKIPRDWNTHIVAVTYLHMLLIYLSKDRRFEAVSCHMSRCWMYDLLYMRWQWRHCVFSHI